MSRIAAGETIEVRPTNNIYTVLAIIAVVMNLIALIVLYMRGNTLGAPLFGGGTP